MTANSELFGNILEYPDPEAQRRFAALVGIDDIKRRLMHEASVLINPAILEQWSVKHHRGALSAIRMVEERTPLIVLAGDVGTGKTELAESVGDAVARQVKLIANPVPSGPKRPWSWSCGRDDHASYTGIRSCPIVAWPSSRQSGTRAECGNSTDGRSRRARAVSRTRSDASRRPRRSQCDHPRGRRSSPRSVTRSDNHVYKPP